MQAVKYAQKLAKNPVKLEDTALLIDSDFCTYILKDGHIVINAGKDGILSIHHSKLAFFVAELLDVANEHKDFLRGYRVPQKKCPKLLVAVEGEENITE